MRRSLGEPLKAYLASFVPDSFVEFATTGGLVVVVTVIRVNQIVCFVIISKKIYIYKGLTAPELLIMKRNNECFGFRCDPPCMQVAPLSTTGNVATPPLEQLSNFRPNDIQILQVSTSHQVPGVVYFLDCNN